MQLFQRCKINHTLEAVRNHPFTYDLLLDYVGNKAAQNFQQAPRFASGRDKFAGQLTENNSVIMNMAAKYVRYFLTACRCCSCYRVPDRPSQQGGSARDTDVERHDGALGVVALAMIFLFKAAEWCEARAKALDDRDDPTDPDFPPKIPVRKLMERAIFMIQLGYRLVVFMRVCIVVAWFSSLRASLRCSGISPSRVFAPNSSPLDFKDITHLRRARCGSKAKTDW